MGAGASLVGALGPGCAPQPVPDAVERRAEPPESAERQATPRIEADPLPSTPAAPDPADAVADAPTGPRAGDVAFHRPQPRPAIAPEAVIAELERIQAENSQPRAPDWERDAGAAVAGDPKLAGRIATLLREPTRTFLTRHIGLALLRTDATPHGQAAVREVLSDPAVQADRMYSTLLLGLAAMPRPDDETVALVESQRGRDDPQVRRAATTVLGTQVWALSVSGRAPRADALAAALTADLKTASDVEDQAVLIQALASGGRPQTRATVRSFASAKDPVLRAAAAKGLASDDAAAATALLMKLLVDPAQAVQSAALDSLFWRTLSAAQHKAVHAAIVKGTLRPENEAVLALFVDRHLVGPARAEALSAIAARNTADERVTAKVRELTDKG